jgi:hypothetical protein
VHVWDDFALQTCALSTINFLKTLRSRFPDKHGSGSMKWENASSEIMQYKDWPRKNI